MCRQYRAPEKLWLGPLGMSGYYICTRQMGIPMGKHSALFLLSCQAVDYTVLQFLRFLHVESAAGSSSFVYAAV